MAVTLLNSAADLSGKTVMVLETAETITALKTFDRDPSAPFAVTSGSAKVSNLDADKVDGYEAAALAVLAENETVTGNWAFSNGLKVSATKALYLDGGGNTYLVESAADTIDLYVGGTRYFRIAHSTAVILLDQADVAIDSLKKLWLDGGSDTYLTESAANVLDVYVGAVKSLSLTATSGTFSGVVGIGTAPLTYIGLYVRPTITSSSTAIGSYSAPIFGSATVTSATAHYIRLETDAAAFTTTTGYGLRIATPTVGAASAITTLYGLKIDNQAGGGTNYAIHTGTGIHQFSAFGAGTATFDASGVISSVSDERFKDIQGPFALGLNAVLGLRPILYTYNTASQLDTDNVYAGFSAQNVLGYVPEAIGKNLDGFYTFNIIPVMAATVTAVQELTAEIDELRAAAGLSVKDRTMVPPASETRMVSSAKALVRSIIRKLDALPSAERTAIETASGLTVASLKALTAEEAIACIRTLTRAQRSALTAAVDTDLPCEPLKEDTTRTMFRDRDASSN